MDEGPVLTVRTVRRLLGGPGGSFPIIAKDADAFVAALDGWLVVFRGDGREPDLLLRRRHVVEQVEQHLDLRLDYEALAQAGSMMGSGGLVVMDETSCMVDIARYFMDFTQAESCGKCTPCRIGSTRGVETIQKIRRREDMGNHVELLRDLCDTMFSGSLCALGGMTPYPVLSALEHFPQDFGLAPQTEQDLAKV